MKINNPNKHFEEYLKSLLKEVNMADSLLELWVHIKNRRKDRLDEMNIAPAFFQLTIYSLMNTLITTLSKLYDSYKTNKRSDRNLIRLINFVEQNISIFPTDPKIMERHGCDSLVSVEMLNRHRDLIKNKKTVLDNLFNWRDKYYSHFDKKYFTEREKLGKDYPLKVADLRDLVETASSILNEYSIVYSGTYSSPRSTNLTDIDKILNILHDCKNTHNQQHKPNRPI